MSIAVLVEVHEEVRRLAIAGSAVAGGDFRLKKLIAPLELAGAKAPVFGRVAHAAQAVVASNEKTASAALLDLATLVNAILYTQGQTGIDGELQAIETTDLGGNATQTSARVLKPLLEALASTGSGRLELVQGALDRGAFKDLRLVKPALSALDDPYSEIGDLIARKVVPLYGKAVVPELRKTLDVKGRGGHLHRLRLLHKLDPEGSQDIVRRALEEGSKEMRVAAIECLGTTGGDLVHLLEQVKSKAKDVRAAALRALSGISTAAADVVGVLKRAIDGADLELFVERLKKCEHPEIRDYVLARADQHLADTLAAKDPKKQGPALERLRHLVRSLEGRADAEPFLLRCIDSISTFAKMKSTPSGLDFNELLAHVLARGTTRTRERLAATYATLTGGMLEPAIDAARETMAPAQFYNEFSPFLAGLAAKRGKKGAEGERAEALASVLISEGRRAYDGPTVETVHWSSDDEEPRRELDPRWLDAAIEAAAVELVCRLARTGHAKVNKFLSEQLTRSKPHEDHNLLETMVRIKHPGAGDAIIDAIKKQAKTSHYGYYTYWFGHMIADLPKSELPKLEALMPTLPDKMVDQLLESVMALKSKPE